MTFEQLQKGEIIENNIKMAEHNIEGYKSFTGCREIVIDVHDDGISCTPRYFTGEIKKEIIELLINNQKQKIKKYLDELEII